MVGHHTETPDQNTIFPCQTGIQGKKTETILYGIENHPSAISPPVYVVWTPRAVDSISLSLHDDQKSLT
jgi:hypothetical protein